MKDYVIATCSTADISQEHMKKRGIEYIAFTYYINGREYKDDLGKTVSGESFYQIMRGGADTKTSQPNKEAYKSFLLPFLKDELDVILLNLSSGISGAQSSGKMAEDELKSQFPNRKIYVVDSLGASSGMGLLVDKMADMRDAGVGIEELYAWVEANKLKVNHWFFSTDLTYYVKGGRVSRVAGWFGTVLKICPILNVDKQGKLIPKEKIRGKTGAIKRMVKIMEENAENGVNYSGKCYISHSDCYEDAETLAHMIMAKFPHLEGGEVKINNIGTTIGAHTGPGTVALFFFGKERES